MPDKYGPSGEELEWHFSVYKDELGAYRWRLLTATGETMAVSSEGLPKSLDCWRAIERIKWHAPQARVVYATEAGNSSE